MTALRLKAKVGPKGQAVIPKPIRDALGIHPGDDVYYSLHEGHAHVEPVPDDEWEVFWATFQGVPLREEDLVYDQDAHYEDEMAGELP